MPGKAEGQRELSPEKIRRTEETIPIEAVLVCMRNLFTMITQVNALICAEVVESLPKPWGSLSDD